MSTETPHLKMDGPVMGTRWNVELDIPAKTDIAALRSAITAAVTRVDVQMSTWNSQSNLMRFNAAPVDCWVEIPRELMQVLDRGLQIGRISDGAFDIGLGDLVRAWGFIDTAPDTDEIRRQLGERLRATHEILDLDEKNSLVRKRAPVSLDLSGIAKGFAVDQMMQVCDQFSIQGALVALDGELRAKGCQKNGKPWVIVVESPDYEGRSPLSILELEDAAVATSGDYRHWVKVGQSRLSHNMDLKKGGPVQPGIASVTVVAGDCITADAMATAVLVLGLDQGIEFAKKHHLDCLIIERKSQGFKQHGVGAIFAV